MKKLLLLTPLAAVMAACSGTTVAPTANLAADSLFDITYNELPSFNPVCDIIYRAPAPIKIDGVISPGEWDAVPALSEFVDIEGKAEFKPHLSTKTKVAYDDQYLYIVADMETPNLWADFTKRDDVICLENDFEVFIDASGDTHDYVEFEINARNTVWDLLMTKPYRDGGRCYNTFNFLDFKTAVKRFGTLNDPSDKDKGWCVEIALPWNELLESRSGERKPVPGEQYRINFLRIEYPLAVENGKYVTAVNPKYDKKMGDHWTWSPIGRIDLHCPDLYGYLQVSDKVAGSGVDSFHTNPDEQIKWMLRRLYYRQKQYSGEAKRFASQLATLKAEEIFSAEQLPRLALHATLSTCEITYDAGDKTWHITQDGKVWSSGK